MPENQEDILAVKGWYTLPDPDDPNSKRIYNQEEKYVASIYTEGDCISIKMADVALSMPDLESAYGWIVSNLPLDIP